MNNVIVAIKFFIIIKSIRRTEDTDKNLLSNIFPNFINPNRINVNKTMLINEGIIARIINKLCNRLDKGKNIRSRMAEIPATLKNFIGGNVDKSIRTFWFFV